MQKTIVIQKTNNYKLFKTIAANREVSKAHIAELTSSIMKRNMLAFNPIIVNAACEIIDGQHRFTVAKNNNLDVYYVILDDANIEEVQQLNATNRMWKSSDYLYSYLMLNKEPYLRFNDYINEFNLSIQQGLIFLMGTDDGRQYTKVFKQGQLAFSDEEMELARYKAGLRQDMKPFFIDTGYNRAMFYRALNVVVETGQGEELLRKLRVSHLPLRAMATKKEYLRLFEDVLNWNRHKESFSFAG